MNEFFKIFDAAGAVTIQQALACAALIVPGFISLRFYELRSGNEARTVSEALVDVVVYSFATDVVAYAGLAVLTAFVPEPQRVATSALFVLAVLLVVPIGLALLLFEVKRRMMRAGLVRNTGTTYWDRVLDSVANGALDFGAILTLRDGRKIGGKLTGRALSSRAAGSEIMLDEVWTIDERRATFVEVVHGSCGVLVDRVDCETIELFEWADVAPPMAENVPLGVTR